MHRQRCLPLKTEQPVFDYDLRLSATVFGKLQNIVIEKGVERDRYGFPRSEPVKITALPRPGHILRYEHRNSEAVNCRFFPVRYFYTAEGVFVVVGIKYGKNRFYLTRLQVRVRLPLAKLGKLETDRRPRRHRTQKRFGTAQIAGKSAVERNRDGRRNPVSCASPAPEKDSRSAVVPPPAAVDTPEGIQAQTDSLRRTKENSRSGACLQQGEGLETGYRKDMDPSVEKGR